MSRDWCRSGASYLASLLDQGDVILDAEWPVHVDVVLVQLQQEHDEDEERVTHQEDEDRLVPELSQFLGYPFLKHRAIVSFRND